MKRLRHGVVPFDLTTLPRCGARARTNGGAPCRRYARKNGRCRLHGGRSTGPGPAGRAALATRSLRHGYYTKAAREWRVGTWALVKRLGEACE